MLKKIGSYKIIHTHGKTHYVLFAGRFQFRTKEFDSELELLKYCNTNNIELQLKQNGYDAPEKLT